mgnify:CR=1 FL=1
MTRFAPTARTTALVLALCSASILGCEASPEADAEPQARVADRTVASISISGTVTDRVSGRVLNAAQVCLHDDLDAPCAYSDDDGTFTLRGVAAEAPVTLEVTREFFQSMLLPITTSDTDEERTVSMLSELAMAIQARRAGVDLDDDAGHLDLQIDEARPSFASRELNPEASRDPKLAPVAQPVWTEPADRFTLAPTKAPEAPRGMAGVIVKPLVSDDEAAANANEAGLIDKGQRRTSASGSAMVFNMRAGRRLASVYTDMNELGCAAQSGWIHPGSDAVAVFPVEPGFITSVSVTCSREL